MLDHLVDSIQRLEPAAVTGMTLLSARLASRRAPLPTARDDELGEHEQLAASLY
jgi:hypothetical protein